MVWCVFGVFSGGLLGLRSTHLYDILVRLRVSSSSSLLLLSTLLRGDITFVLSLLVLYGLSFALVLHALASRSSARIKRAALFFFLRGLPPGPMFFLKLLAISLLFDVGGVYYSLLLSLGDTVAWLGYMKLRGRLT